MSNCREFMEVIRQQVAENDAQERRAQMRYDNIACPNGIPPWNPPQDGERLAYEGWAEWVQEHGGFSHHMQLIAYRVEKSAKAFTDALAPAFKNAADSINKFMRGLEAKQ